MKLGCIIQARMGSTRFPGKMNKEFHNGKTILDVIVEKMKLTFSNEQIILATSDDLQNQKLIKKCKEHSINSFVGSENDVLSRFIECAKKFSLTHIVRVCGDNPFLIEEMNNELLKEFYKNNTYDYYSYYVKDTPSILTHFGFWFEIVGVNALKKVQKVTSDPLYHEHVTNYIYQNKDQFKIKSILLDSFFEENTDKRFTVDTEEDFHTCSIIYKNFCNQKIDPIILFNFVNKSKSMSQLMHEQINRNIK